MKPRLFLLLLLALSVATHAADLAGEARKAQLAYAQKLDQLLAKAKTDGDTAAAKEIEAMIAQVEAKAPAAGKDDAPVELQRIVGKWKRDRDGMLWEFTDTKSGVAGGNTKFTVSYDASKKQIQVITDKFIDTLKFSSDEDLLRGTDRRGDRYTLTRVK